MLERFAVMTIVVLLLVAVMLVTLVPDAPDAGLFAFIGGTLLGLASVVAVDRMARKRLRASLRDYERR